MALKVDWVVTGAFQENAYVLTCTDTQAAILVDPGDDVAAIVALVERVGAKPVGVWNTHAHLDHVAGVAELQERWQLPFRCAAADFEWLEGLPLQARMFGMVPPRVPAVAGPIEDGDAVVFGHVRGEALATPGHTEGGICFWFPEAKVLVTGDTLFVGSVGRTDLPGGDFEALERSIRRLYTLPDDVTFYAGHGGPGLLGREKRTNPFVQAE
jgi:glyoxylase-like metal-dependent hydrolase (beta-lactamase superfamily II)